jgi:uncharacterized protein YndB with AHSA1/START domain
MRQVDASQQLPATPERTFEFVSDLANLPRWQTGIVSAELTSPLPVGIGSTAHVVRELMGQRIAVDLRVTAYEPGRRLGLSSAASGIGIEAVLELEPAASGTLARFTMDIKAQNVFMKPMEGMVAGAASSDLATSLDRLRTALQDA